VDSMIYRRFQVDPKIHPRIQLHEAMAIHEHRTGRPAVLCCTNIAIRQRLQEPLSGYAPELPLEVLDVNWVVGPYFNLRGELEA
jgi:hypothetical protein